jgi:hypothetical protein
MTVTKAEFKAMPVTPYAQARSTPGGLRTGDVLLFNASDFGSALIEAVTGSLWCHAAFIWRVEEVDRLLALEAVPAVGVRALTLSAKINGVSASPKPFSGGLLVVRHDDLAARSDPAAVRAMTEFALDRIGFPYSDTELEEIGVRIGEALVGDKDQDRVHIASRDAYICSDYVAGCFHAMGVDLAPNPRGYIVPGDIANDPRMRAVWSLRHD